ncbi:MAG: hypothetical protein QM690_09020 [Sphingobium sp.]
MSIGSVGSSNNPLISALRQAGLSSDKIGIVQEDVEEVVANSIPAGSGVDGLTVRQALDAQIAEDVKSGDLSEEDAAKIAKVLDEMEGKAAGETAETAGGGEAQGAGGGGPAGGGGGGGSTEKTELSRTETVSGGIKTTTITYTDGTTETETSFVSEPDTKSAANAAKEDTASNDIRTAQDYLSKIEPGTLFDAYA